MIVLFIERSADDSMLVLGRSRVHVDLEPRGRHVAANGFLWRVTEILEKAEFEV